MVSSLLAGMSAELAKCPGASADMSRLNAWGSTFATPADFAALATGNLVSGGYRTVVSARGAMAAAMR